MRTRTHARMHTHTHTHTRARARNQCPTPTVSPRPQSIAMKIEAGTTDEKSRLYGRHFDHTDQLVSKISRESIDALKQFFADEMTKDDWRLILKLKKTFQVT
jgi:hypothetical protein